MRYTRYNIFKLAASVCLWSLCIVALSACTDDNLDGVTGGDSTMTEVILQLDFDVPEGDMRTRTSDALGSSDVESLWVGVYDVTTGKRVGSAFFASPGSPIKLPVIFYDAHPQVAIVGVANYSEATDYSGAPLWSLLNGAETWNSLLNIDVKAPHGEVNPGEPQVMMGLLTGNGARAFFKSSEKGSVSIENANDWQVTLTPTGQQYGSMIHQIKNKKIYLYRLFSRVNVNIIAGENAEVTDISYRRCHMPQATFLAERPTYTGDVKTWKTFKAGTPNFADTQMTPSNGLIINAPCYISDGENEWTSVAGSNSFSFAHLDNKHWKAPDVSAADLAGHDKREAFSKQTEYNEQKILKGLGHPYNNYASYFVVKMTVLDKKNNKSAEVEYTIHEGYINDAKGNIVSSEVKNGDYCAFRNTVYNYNITVNGIDYITYNVTQSEAHHDGASGNIWDTEISAANELYGTITVSPNSASVFRFYVGRGDETPLDFISGSTEGMNGVFWPSITSNTAFDQIPDNINSSFSFTKDGKTLTLAQFLGDARTSGGTYTVVFNPENPEKKRINPDAYKLGVYHYNPGETGPSTTDSDGCTVYTGKKFHVVEWLPSLPVKLQPLAVSNQSTKRFINNNLSIDFKSAVEGSANNSFKYGEDYIYMLTIGGKNYKLEAPDFKYTLPISQLVDSDTYTYTVKAIAINDEEYYDSDDANAQITFGYPNWNFTSSNWVNAYKKWGGGDGKTYSEFSNQKKENVVDKLSLEAGSGKKIRGYYAGSSPYLNLQNSGPNNDIIFTVYQNCNISISGTGGKDDKGNARKINVVNGDQLESQDEPGSFTYKTKVQLNEGETSRTIKIYTTGGSMSFKNIALTVLK